MSRKFRLCLHQRSILWDLLNARQMAQPLHHGRGLANSKKKSLFIRLWYGEIGQTQAAGIRARDLNSRNADHVSGSNPSGSDIFHLSLSTLFIRFKFAYDIFTMFLFTLLHRLYVTRWTASMMPSSQPVGRRFHGSLAPLVSGLLSWQRGMHSSGCGVLMVVPILSG